MDAEAKIIEIEKLYGSSNFRGKPLRSMYEGQIHAIYGKLCHSGMFEKYESLKDSYVALFPNDRYVARKRANSMSIFELQEIIPKVLADKEHKLPEGYQFTLQDWLNELEGKELNENGNND
jgi:hypothetical protein